MEIDWNQLIGTSPLVAAAVYLVRVGLKRLEKIAARIEGATERLEKALTHHA